MASDNFVNEIYYYLIVCHSVSSTGTTEGSQGKAFRQAPLPGEGERGETAGTAGGSVQTVVL
jgi:hypothetical protein